MFGLNTQQFAALFIVFFYALSYLLAFLYHNVLLHRLPANQQARLQELVQIGTKAAMDTSGNLDKQHALQAVQNLCKQFKINFDLLSVTHFIDAAAYELKMLVPATAPIVNAVDQGLNWLNDVNVKSSIASNTANPGTAVSYVQQQPQGLPVIPASLPGQQGLSQ